jgi:hypothetical protein
MNPYPFIFPAIILSYATKQMTQVTAAQMHGKASGSKTGAGEEDNEVSYVGSIGPHLFDWQ